MQQDEFQFPLCIETCDDTNTSTQIVGTAFVYNASEGHQKTHLPNYKRTSRAYPHFDRIVRSVD